jgi:heat-inducible transcriptional repressor
MINELNQRTREIFREIVETYCATGEPVGSRTLSRRLPLGLSPATIRNVMADLEDLGLLYAPHTSAGRLPTERGLRLFVDGLLQIGDLTDDERESITALCAGNGRSLTEVLHQATELLSGMTSTASLVCAPKSEAPVKHVEFVGLSPGTALVIMVTETGLVENRLVQLPDGFTPSTLVEASNYLNSRLSGRTLDEARVAITAELAGHEAQLDELAAGVVEAGIATWSSHGEDNMLIVRGRAKLFEDVNALADLERLRELFDTLDRKKNLLKLIDSTQGGEGVHVFIGAENRLFDLSGCSMIVAPLGNRDRDGGGPRYLGAIGVIGPTRINYARIIPMVDYTARAISRLVS